MTNQWAVRNATPVTPDNPREMTSKFDGFCKECKTPIKEGDTILWMGPGAGSKHKECPYIPETELIMMEEARQAKRRAPFRDEWESDLVVSDSLELHYHGSHFAVPIHGSDQVSFFRFDRPKQGKYAGNVYLNVIIGGGVGGGDGVKERVARQPKGGKVLFVDENTADLYANLIADVLSAPQTAMQFYGALVGRCGYCRKLLTDPTSRSRGIGPECWKVRGFHR